MEIICLGCDVEELFLVKGNLYYAVWREAKVGDLIKIPAGGIRKVLTEEDLTLAIGTKTLEPIGIKIYLSEDDKITYELKEIDL